MTYNFQVGACHTNMDIKLHTNYSGDKTKMHNHMSITLLQNFAGSDYALPKFKFPYS